MMKNDFMEKLAAENPDLLGENGAVYGWIKDGCLNKSLPVYLWKLSPQIMM